MEERVFVTQVRVRKRWRIGGGGEVSITESNLGLGAENILEVNAGKRGGNKIELVFLFVLLFPSCWDHVQRVSRPESHNHTAQNIQDPTLLRDEFGAHHVQYVTTGR